ncbi:transcription factor-like protein [Trypanosoma rangeli]|uniref:Transcription factor-like protein n=1 Tax=Trypanosoma rangeli TaxID=5698 RepID=A0A3R7MD54_TRYRA|nr:transcription factor-like protein [Trypanosoma rangeli]RNF00413.1 transcription factor-like protein [Trypanosoma rangeli]|eukprot:RNF00413.1 transcription factor-like protein [Trypanosoma rangeli]
MLLRSEEGNGFNEEDSGVLPERSKEIIQQLRLLRYECASCLCNIRHDVAVWSCSECFRIFHLYCIKKWSKQTESGVGSSFRCPQCQVTQESVSKYLCFCGKIRDPPYDPHVTPHSCGQKCGKKRPLCDHLCPVQCHPGPCPECPFFTVPKPCHCGATTYMWRCGQPDPQKSCDNVCSKRLNCSIHTCKRKCHAGACDPCPERILAICHCELETRELPCGSTSFSCGRVCGKTLRCGVHVCDLFCHSGACPPCVRDPSIIVTCPCGYVPLTVMRTRCSDPIPTCGKSCGRVLDCQRHTCQALCHEGACEPCQQRALTKCVCGATQKLVPCTAQDGFCCNIICKAKLSCGKHTCRAKCCPARKQQNSVVHQCNQICNKKLHCGHACLEACHRGMCPPCVHVVPERLVCRCGAEVLMPPQPCGTPPPTCRRACTLPLSCNHPSVKHNCHYGECPPCMFPVEKICVGGHTVVKNAPCSAAFVCCSSKCGKLLACDHACPRVCHPDLCMDEQHPCLQLCGKLYAECGHACKAKCHFLKACPPCTETVVCRCQCGRQTRHVPCRKFLRYVREHAGEGMTIKCDADCLFNRRLDILARRCKPSVPSLPTPVKYSLLLWDFGSKNPTWVGTIEEELERFVSSHVPLVSLKPMPPEKRAVVHSLCHYYHIFSESVDAEPNRSCLLTRTAATSLPAPLLSAALADPDTNNPHTFIQQICENGEEGMREHVLLMEGENVNAVVVSRILHDFAGEFVCGAEEATRDEKRRMRVYFVHSSRQQQAYRHLRSVRPPFEVYLPSRPGEEITACAHPPSSISWAKLVCSKTKGDFE